MRPVRIVMKGFGAFREPTEIDLSDVDLIALVGPTGSGKSTIIDAITFALYGTVARYEDNRLVAPVINQTSNEARVSLDFELDGVAFTAVRVVRRTPSGASTKEARLERGEDVVADDARSVSREVAILLGLDVDQFNRTVVLPQGKFATFLHDKPSDRQTTLVQLLGLDLYRRIGKAARRRAGRLNAQADLLRPDLAGETDYLTDERRTALKDRVARLDAARSHLRSATGKISVLDSKLRRLTGEIKRLDDRIDRVEAVSAPPGIAELAGRITKAATSQTKAEQQRKELSAKRRLAGAARRSGPDIVTVQLGLETYSELAQRSQAHDEVSKRLEAARKDYESAQRGADLVRDKQSELDRHLHQARETEHNARAARDEAITVTQVNAWSATHTHYQTALKTAEKADAAARAAESSIQPLKSALASAEDAVAESSTRVTELRRRAGVLGYVDMVEIGSDCPLCLQEVHELPDHDIDTDLRQAEAGNEAAVADRAEARQAFEDAEKQLIRRHADVSSARKAVADREHDITSIPASDQLAALRATATGLAENVRIAREATRQAETAASQHRGSPIYLDALKTERNADGQVTQLAASENLLRTQLMSVRAKVADVPGKDELEAQLAEAEHLRTDLENAEKRFNDADANYEGLTADLAEVNRQRDQAIELLQASRDQVAEFGPPPSDTTDLVVAWNTLTNWTANEAYSAAAERRVTVDKKSETESLRTELVDTSRTLCVEVLGDVDPDTEVSEMSDMLAHHSARAMADLKGFDERLDNRNKLKERIGGLTEQASVATKLGGLLRADGFEGWLMEAALDELVERATRRLFELSGSQYSLTVHKRDFAVRDHANADELRSARTLSGGETFLASLSLALALADATAELAPEGAPVMESIFLDEGFGTLDPHTLDTVATAVEELGSTGRFVGIVTHIPELADRMPVRLEVTKSSGAATVQRVEI